MRKLLFEIRQEQSCVWLESRESVVWIINTNIKWVAECILQYWAIHCSFHQRREEIRKVFIMYFHKSSLILLAFCTFSRFLSWKIHYFVCSWSSVNPKNISENDKIWIIAISGIRVPNSIQRRVFVCNHKIF